MYRTTLLFLSLICATGFASAQTNTPPAPDAVGQAVSNAFSNMGQPDATGTNGAAQANPVVTSTDAPMALPQAPLQVGQPGMPGAAAPGTPKQEDIADIRPPFFFLHSWFWVWVALGVVAAIALIIVLWRWLKPNRQLSPLSAYELTLQKLEKARGLLREETAMPYAVLVSETIRSYLGQRFQAPSTRRTTEEFLKQMEASEGTPLSQYRDLLREFLQSCDLVKFGRYQPTLAELEQVQDRAQNFVAATKPELEVKA